MSPNGIRTHLLPLAKWRCVLFRHWRNEHELTSFRPYQYGIVSYCLRTRNRHFRCTSFELFGNFFVEVTILNENFLLVENGHTRNPLTLCSVPAIVHVQVWVHIPGGHMKQEDPQNAHLRNATTQDEAGSWCHGKSLSFITLLCRV